jgi:hypothetical protein
VNGSLEMNKPDFSTMSSRDLRAYALVHREDDAVFTELIKRVRENGKRYPAPKTDADLEEMRKLFQRKVPGDNVD